MDLAHSIKKVQHYAWYQGASIRGIEASRHRGIEALRHRGGLDANGGCLHPCASIEQASNHRATIGVASSLHRACIEPASSHSIKPASSFQHRASRPGLEDRAEASKYQVIRDRRTFLACFRGIRGQIVQNRGQIDRANLCKCVDFNNILSIFSGGVGSNARGSGVGCGGSGGLYTAGDEGGGGPSWWPAL